MEIHNKCSHINCVNFLSHSNSPVATQTKLAGEYHKYYAQTNEIIFIFQGKIDLTFNQAGKKAYHSNTAIFVCAGNSFSFEVIKDCFFIIFRLGDVVKFCDTFTLSTLKEYASANPSLVNHNKNVKFTTLPIHQRISPLLDCVKQYIDDGLSCHLYLDAKIREFFMLLNIYYPLHEVYDFFRLNITEDVDFSEFVRANWKKHGSIDDLAETMGLSRKQFANSFKNSFNTTPYKWMKAERSKLILNELVTSKRPIKEIAYGNGFSTLSQFSKFCTTEIGKSPSEIRKNQATILPDDLNKANMPEDLGNVGGGGGEIIDAKTGAKTPQKAACEQCRVRGERVPKGRSFSLRSK